MPGGSAQDNITEMKKRLALAQAHAEVAEQQEEPPATASPGVFGTMFGLVGVVELCMTLYDHQPCRITIPPPSMHSHS